MSSQTWFDLGSRRILQIGCGAIGGTMLSLYMRHFTFQPKQIMVIDMREDAIKDASVQYPDIRFFHKKVTRENVKRILEKLLRPGDLLLDLAWYLDTLTLTEWCHDHNVLFVNTAVETWEEDECALDDKACQTLYSRQLVIRDRVKEWSTDKTPTAILTHGANPGWVSHAVKMGIADWVAHLIKQHPEDKSVRKAASAVVAKQYNEAAMHLGIQVIHIAERDTQVSSIPKRTNEFVNTWSPMGFVEEATAPAELGWGTHETLKQGVNHYKQGPRNQVYFDTMGMNTMVRSWVPSGDIAGMVVRHEEAFSISEYLTVTSHGKAVYRPTVHYAYMSCGESIASLYEMQAAGYSKPKEERVLKGDMILEGSDELGCFMMSKHWGCWWIGSLLNKQEADALLEGQSATVLQVASSVLSSLVYAFHHPQLGMVHPDQLDPLEIMQYVTPYLGRFVSFPKDWKPKVVRNKSFEDHPDWVIQKLLI